MALEISRLSIVVCGDRKDYLDQEYGPHIWRTLADNGFAEGKSIGGVGFCRDFENDRLITVLPKAFSSWSCFQIRFSSCLSKSEASTNSHLAYSELDVLNGVEIAQVLQSRREPSGTTAASAFDQLLVSALSDSGESAPAALKEQALDAAVPA
jgi:hypothetical protein